MVPFPVARTYAARGLVLWLAAHTTLLVLTLLSGGELAARHVTIDAPGAAAPTIVLATIAMGVIDVRIRRERPLLANLGVSSAALVLMLLATAMCAETALALATAPIRAR